MRPEFATSSANCHLFSMLKKLNFNNMREKQNVRFFENPLCDGKNRTQLFFQFLLVFVKVRSGPAIFEVPKSPGNILT